MSTDRPEEPEMTDTPPRLFRLLRAVDVTGVSGAGHAADGIRWDTKTEKTPEGQSTHYTVETPGTYRETVVKTPWCRPIDRHRTDHITRHDPAQVLKAVAAQKALLLEYAVAKRFYDANPSTPAGELEGLHTAIKRLHLQRPPRLQPGMGPRMSRTARPWPQDRMS